METHADQSSFWFMLSCSDPLQLISQQQIARVQKLAKPELEREMSEDGFGASERILSQCCSMLTGPSAGLLSSVRSRECRKWQEARVKTSAYRLHPFLSAVWQKSIGVQGRHAWRLLVNGLAASSFEAKHAEPNCFFLLTSHRLPCWQRTEGCSQCSCHT